MPLNTRTPSGEFAAGASKPASMRTGSADAADRTTIAVNAKATQVKLNLFPNLQPPASYSLQIRYSLRHSTEEDLMTNRFRISGGAGIGPSMSIVACALIVVSAVAIGRGQSGARSTAGATARSIKLRAPTSRS